MTRISYIHGPVPVDEFRDRAKEVGKPDYINPLVLTDGGMYLRLMRNQVKTLAQYYPEDKKYRKGLALIDNALHRGIHGAVPYIGAVEPSLYPVMRAIDVYKLRRQPAMRQAALSGSWRDESLVAGIGADQIPTITDIFPIWWWQNDTKWLKGQNITNAQGVKNFIELIQKQDGSISIEEKRHYQDFKRQYDNKRYIINLYNSTLQKFAHHPLYNFLPQKNEYPPAVIMKNIMHRAGIEAMANTGGWSVDNMALWTRNAILQENIEKEAGALSPEKTAFALTGLPDDLYAQFLGSGPGGVKPSRPGADKIGIADIIVVAIIGAISAAITGALAFLDSAQKTEQAKALASVQGWGTNAYAADQKDWPPEKKLPPTTTTESSNLPLLIGAGAGLLLLTQK